MSNRSDVTTFNKGKLMLGWVSKITKRRVSYYVSIESLVAKGTGLRKGQKLHSYFLEETGRPIMKTYLDGLDKDGNKFEQDIERKVKTDDRTET